MENYCLSGCSCNCRLVCTCQPTCVSCFRCSTVRGFGSCSALGVPVYSSAQASKGQCGETAVVSTANWLKITARVQHHRSYNVLSDVMNFGVPFEAVLVPARENEFFLSDGTSFILTTASIEEASDQIGTQYFPMTNIMRVAPPDFSERSYAAFYKR